MPKEMRRIDGHICQPVLEWIRSQVDMVPEGSGGKERCLLAKEEQAELMQTQMLKIHRHIRRRVVEGAIKNGKMIKEEWAQESWEDGIENMIREERWRMLWERWARSRPQAMEENNLRGFQEVFKRVVVCHIDKHNSEGLLI